MNREHQADRHAYKLEASTQEITDGAIAAAYASGGYSMKAVGDQFGLGYSMVSRIIRNAGSPPKGIVQKKTSRS